MEMARKDGMCWHYPICKSRLAPGCNTEIGKMTVAVCREHSTSSKYPMMKDTKGT